MAELSPEAREKALKDINSIRGEAMREGKEEGRREGIKEGKREIAKKMLMEGADINFIVKITELTESEVLELKDEMN
ncbi:hypothetical protein [Caldifermentibacillus hisashii]|jgi:predicted transposase/invertase (TIGR01784 family)|uniref:hypothetical protein n=1 Tax=Caldifermentibacillus hisashii TaxID=996558 RepID=UPI0034245388